MDRSEVLLGTRRFRVVRKTYRPRTARNHRREIIEHPGAVTILAMTTDDQVVLIRNYRTAVEQELLELPAGTLSREKTRWRRPAANSKKKPVSSTALGAAMPVLHVPGILRERMHLYLASDLEIGNRTWIRVNRSSRR